MNENEKPPVNTDSAKELGRELKEESDIKQPSGKLTHKDYSDPLFLKNNPEGQKGDAQDEKDATEE